FTKAFQRLHGITPSAARKMNVKLKSFPPLSFQIQIKGNVEMNYRIVDEKATIIVGKEVLIENDPYIEIPKFVEQIWVNGTVEQIGKLYELPKDELLFGYHFDIKEDGTRRYLMGTHLPDG